MNQQILKYIPEYGVLLCMICKKLYCVPLNGIAEHFNLLHSDSVSKAERKELVKYARILKNELQDSKEIKLISPPFQEGPIDRLHQIHGYACDICGKFLPELISIEQHYRVYEWRTWKPEM